MSVGHLVFHEVGGPPGPADGLQRSLHTGILGGSSIDLNPEASPNARVGLGPREPPSDPRIDLHPRKKFARLISLTSSRLKSLGCSRPFVSEPKFRNPCTHSSACDVGCTHCSLLKRTEPRGLRTVWISEQSGRFGRRTTVITEDDPRSDRERATGEISPEEESRERRPTHQRRARALRNVAGEGGG